MLIRAAVAGVPSYSIYPIPNAGGYSPIWGSGVSTSGNYASAMVEPSQVSSNGVLYNVANGSSTFETQTGVTYGRGTVETTGVPYSVNNNGLMFGSSGAGSIVETGAPTVWQNGAGYNLPMPYGTAGGQAFGSNDLNQAVGSVKLSSAGADNAAIFEWSGPNSINNNAFILSQVTDPNNASSTNLNVAYGINNAGQIVGQANQVNLGAGYVPFILSSASAATASVIPGPTPAYNGGEAFAISDNGLVTGSYSANYSNSVAFVYNSSSGVTFAVPNIPGVGGLEGRGINSSGEVVGDGSNLYAIPFLFDGTNTYDLQTLLTNNQSGAWGLDDNTSSGAYGISDYGDIVGRGMYNGNLTAFIMIPNGTTKASPQNLTFNNAGGTGDGITWDTSQQNWNNGSGVTTFSSVNGDYVQFTDVNNGHYNVSIPATMTPGSTTFNNSSGNYVVSGAGGIGGGGVFYKYGTGTLTLDTINTYTGPTNMDGGTVILGVNGALPVNTDLQINGTGTTVVVKSLGTAYAVTLSYVGIYGGDALDLTNNDLILTGDYAGNINGLLKTGYNGGNWNGTGITTSLGGASHPLMALGMIVNDNGQGTPLYGSGGTIASTFGGQTPVDGDILVKYTYYGDANLDGKVDGSDYSLIDNAYLADQAYLATNPGGTAIPYTGWWNGDFNYDGVVDGSDYTLIDNAFNSQGAVIATALAGSTAQIAGATAAVPEPAGLSALGLVGTGMLSRRRKKRDA